MDFRQIIETTEYDFLRINPMKDVIEWQLDEVLDINGWDLRKALLSFSFCIDGEMCRWKEYCFEIRKG